MNLGQHGLCMGLRLYQAVVSPCLTALFGPGGWGCRFTPTCSQYALDAVMRHGVLKGTCLAVGRLFRCHPWGGCGHDPVPASGMGLGNGKRVGATLPGNGVGKC